MRRHHLSSFGHAEPRHARRNDERRNFRAPVFAFAGARKHGVEVGDAGVGNEALAAVDDISVVFTPRGRLEGGHVRAGVRLSQSKSSDGFAAPHARQPEIAHMFRGREANRVGAQSLHYESQIRK